MVENTAAEAGDEVKEGEPKAGSSKRAKSLIEFPYADLEQSAKLARKLREIGGQTKIEQKQLAVALNQTVTGGTFRGRLSAAKMFGFINTERDMVWLEPLGLRASDTESSDVAYSEAFLKVALYKKMYEAYSGYALPPAAAIERWMETLGVPTKQKARARTAFQASASFAGYIASNGRFSKPIAVSAPPLPGEAQDAEDAGEGRSGHGGGNGSGDGPPPPPPDSLVGQLLAKFPNFDPNWDAELKREWFKDFRDFMSIAKVSGDASS